jgi:hypothetical protein
LNRAAQSTSVRDPDEVRRYEVAREKPLRFYLGVAMILASYGTYPLYAALPLLPIPARLLSPVLLSVWGFGWAVFVLGTLLAGKDGTEYLKKQWRRLRGA